MICGIIGPVDGGGTKETQRVLAAGEGGLALRRALDLEIGRLEGLRARAWIALGLVVMAASTVVFLQADAGVGIAGLLTGSVLIAWFSLGAWVLLPRRRLRAFYTWVTVVVEATTPWIFQGAIAVFASPLLALREWGPLTVFSCVLVIGILRLSPRAMIAIGAISTLTFAVSTTFFILPAAGTPIEPLLGPWGQLVRGMACLLGTAACAFVAHGLRTAVRGVVRTLRATDLFGKYRIEGPLGEGGMGVVYRATYCPEGGFMRPAAIKLVHAHLASNPDLVEKFRTEASLGARLVHDHIVQVFDFGKVDETYFLAMEFVDGATLSEIMKRAAISNRRLPETVAAAIGKGVLEGLAFAHEHARDADGQLLRVIHRDLSPHNILVSLAGVAKISDFGIARALREARDVHTEHIAGHLSHMAPEQVNAEPLDARADLFVAGTLLWEMLTGEPLWRRPTEAAMMFAIARHDAPRPSSIDPSLARWDAFFARALRKQRDQRFQSAREMLRHMALIVGDVDPDATRSFLHALPPLPTRGLAAAPTDATVDVRPPGDATINEQTLV